jgi:hypothetical protein
MLTSAGGILALLQDHPDVEQGKSSDAVRRMVVVVIMVSALGLLLSWGLVLGAMIVVLVVGLGHYQRRHDKQPPSQELNLKVQLTHFALRKLDLVVDEFWAEISDSIQTIEVGDR